MTHPDGHQIIYCVTSYFMWLIVLLCLIILAQFGSQICAFYRKHLFSSDVVPVSFFVACWLIQIVILFTYVLFLFTIVCFGFPRWSRSTIILMYRKHCRRITSCDFFFNGSSRWSSNYCHKTLPYGTINSSYIHWLKNWK